MGLDSIQSTATDLIYDCKRGEECTRPRHQNLLLVHGTEDSKFITMQGVTLFLQCVDIPIANCLENLLMSPMNVPPQYCQGHNHAHSDPLALALGGCIDIVTEIK